MAVLTPKELIDELANREVVETAEISDELANKLQKYVDEGYLVILMTAGPADAWFRKVFSK